jgi:hypothetical protein
VASYDCLDFLDLATHQAYSLHKVIIDENDMSMVEFKRGICEELVTPYQDLDNRTKKRRRTVQDGHVNINVEHMLGSNTHEHMLIENKDKMDIHCYFCLLRNIKK